MTQTRLAFEQGVRWIFREQPIPDVGIDAQAEVVDGERATGRLLGLQIKGGASWFRRHAPGGWWYRPDSDHVDYWLNHSIPVVVVLYNPKTQLCHWQLINTQTLESTPAGGWKLLVPEENVLDETARRPLQELATGTASTDHQRTPINEDLRAVRWSSGRARGLGAPTSAAAAIALRRYGLLRAGAAGAASGPGLPPEIGVKNPGLKDVFLAVRVLASEGFVPDPMTLDLERLELSNLQLDIPADFSGANLANSQVDYQPNLADADFHGADVSSTQFDHATLTGANFDGATAVGTLFIDAILNGASFDGTDVTGADFRGSETGPPACLINADLSGAIGLDEALLDGVVANDKTRWPTGFDVQAHGVQQGDRCRPVEP